MHEADVDASFMRKLEVSKHFTDVIRPTTVAFLISLDTAIDVRFDREGAIVLASHFDYDIRRVAVLAAAEVLVSCRGR